MESKEQPDGQTPQGETDVVPAGQKASWGSFLKSIMGFTGDLSSLTAPSFILSSTSLTEYSAYWCEHPELFTDIAEAGDAERRALAVLRWFIATLKGQYSSRNESLGSEKKPLNPILGELFLGSWTTERSGETLLFSEQVSHHPPVTAYYMCNDKHGILLQGHSGQKTSFSGRTLTVRQVGHAVLKLRQPEESYLITLPTLKLEGLIYGRPYVELNGHSYIQSSAGYLATIEYSGKGWISGKKNSFKATLARDTDRKSPLYTIQGTWTDFCTVTHEKTMQESVFWDAKANPPLHVTVPDIADQGEWESRRIWQDVATALNNGDYETASREKTKIEQWQRQMRIKEKEEVKEWKRHYFLWHERDALVIALETRMPSSAVKCQEGGHGSWIFTLSKKD